MHPSRHRFDQTEGNRPILADSPQDVLPVVAITWARRRASHSDAEHGTVGSSRLPQDPSPHSSTVRSRRSRQMLSASAATAEPPERRARIVCRWNGDCPGRLKGALASRESTSAGNASFRRLMPCAIDFRRASRIAVLGRANGSSLSARRACSLAARCDVSTGDEVLSRQVVDSRSRPYQHRWAVGPQQPQDRRPDGEDSGDALRHVSGDSARGDLHVLGGSMAQCLSQAHGRQS